MEKGTCEGKILYYWRACGGRGDWEFVGRWGNELSFGSYCFVSGRMCDLETAEGRVAVGEIEKGAFRPLFLLLKTLKKVC